MILVPALFGIGCSASMEEPPVAADQAATELPLLAGYSWDDDALTAGGNCLADLPSDTVDGLAEFNLETTRVENARQAATKIGFTSKGSYQAGVARASAKASLAAETEESELTATYLVHASLVTRRVQVQPHAALRPEYVQMNPIDFRTACGTHYASRVNQGGRLSAFIQFKFTDREMKQRFAAEFSASNASGSFSGALSRESMEKRRAARMEIKFRQEGGDAATLYKAFAGRDVATCSLADAKQCTSILSSLIDYAKGDFATSVQAHPTTIDFDIHPYADRELPILPQEIDQKRVDTLKEFDISNNDLARANALLNLAEYIVPEEVRPIDALKKATERDIEKILQNIRECYKPAATNCRTPHELALEVSDPSKSVLTPPSLALPEARHNSPYEWEIDIPANYAAHVNATFTNAVAENAVYVMRKGTSGAHEVDANSHYPTPGGHAYEYPAESSPHTIVVQAIWKPNPRDYFRESNCVKQEGESRRNVYIACQEYAGQELGHAGVTISLHR